MSPQTSLDSLLLDLERRLLAPGTPSAELETLIAADFGEIGSSGLTYDRAQILDYLLGRAAGPVQAIDFRDLRSFVLAPGVVLVTYETVRQGSEGAAASRALRSSIWVERDGRWQIRFHQGTPIPT